MAGLPCLAGSPAHMCCHFINRSFRWSIEARHASFLPSENGMLPKGNLKLGYYKTGYFLISRKFQGLKSNGMLQSIRSFHINKMA